MSQPHSNDMTPGAPSNTQGDRATAPAPKKKAVAYSKECAVLAHRDGPVLAAGKGLGHPGAYVIGARLLTSMTANTNPWMGFSLSIPLGDGQVTNEGTGYGVRYTIDLTKGGSGLVTQSDVHRVTVRFPRGGFTASFEDPTPALASLFPGANKLCLVRVQLGLGRRVTVTGFGMPFANLDNPELEACVNQHAPIASVGGTTLLGLLRQTEFWFVVLEAPAEVRKKWNEDLLPPPFSYGDLYGTEHGWALERYEKQLQVARSPEPFRAVFSYDDDNSHVAVVTQTVVQDFYWLHKAVGEIRSVLFPAYFVRRGDSDSRYYAVIQTTKDFREKYTDAWGQLAKENDAVLLLRVDDDAPPVEWKCTIIDHPKAFTELDQHPTEDHEVVVMAFRPFKDMPGADLENWVAFLFESEEKEAKRKVTATCSLLPSAPPTNPEAVGKGDLGVEDRMELHRALWRGNGFYEWMTRGSPNLEQAMANLALEDPPARALPVVNLANIDDDRYRWALFEEALPHDRAPFRQYMAERHLGVGIITAAPGFGKTTLLAVAGISMHASLGPIFCSGPSNVAVDNLASRLDKITTSVCKRYNDGKPEGDPTRRCRLLVVRAYHVRHEESTFNQLLEFPDKDPVLRGSTKSPWKLHLSLAYWALVILGSKAKGIKELDADDSEALHGLRQEYAERRDYADLRAVAAGEKAFAELKTGPNIRVLFGEIIRRADMVCTTPARSEDDKSDVVDFKKAIARGILVDEAANMTRADMHCVWGNCLLPCVMGGDAKQLEPMLQSANLVDELGNVRHRLPEDAAISPMTFLQVSGIPVYRLKMQLRMAKGLFDWVGAELYPEVPFGYGAQCDISLPHFAAGRALEARAKTRFPGLGSPPPGEFRPLFLHCEGSRVYVDDVTGSRLCPVQSKASLDFALDLVSNAGIKAKDILIIAPYAANVKHIERLRKKREYGPLLEMPPASTVDACQGQENAIVIATLGTTFPYPGPGFTRNEHRLNVLLTRQMSGLVVVGDINIDGLDEEEEKGKGKGKGKKAASRPGKLYVKSRDGKGSWVTAVMLTNIYRRFLREKRVARLPKPVKEVAIDGPAA